MTDDPRARILRVSLDLFAERGFPTVTVREIADRVGLTKTAVLYHFPSKVDILVALMEPLLTECEAVAQAARAIDDRPARRWALLEGIVDLGLAHRKLMQIHMQSQALSADETLYARMRDFALQVQDLLAEPDADLADRVRAAQIYAAVSDPVVIFADQPRDQLRAAILEGVALLLDSPRPSHSPPPTMRRGALTASAPAARRGRPGIMTSEMIESARRMRDSGAASTAEIAATLGVSRATLYRHLGKSSQ